MNEEFIYDSQKLSLKFGWLIVVISVTIIIVLAKTTTRYPS